MKNTYNVNIINNKTINNNNNNNNTHILVIVFIGNYKAIQDITHMHIHLLKLK